MISRTLPPKTDLDTFTVYEGNDLSRVPPKADLVRGKTTVLVFRFKWWE